MLRPWQRWAICTIICNYNGKLTYGKDGVHLVCDMTGTITPNYIKELEEELDELFQERSSIKEYEANMSREQAEAQAFDELKKELVK